MKIGKEKFLTTRQASEYLGYSSVTIGQYVQRGLIRAEKLGNILVVRQSELDDFQRNRRRKVGRPKNSEK